MRRTVAIVTFCNIDRSAATVDAQNCQSTVSRHFTVLHVRFPSGDSSLELSVTVESEVAAEVPEDVSLFFDVYGSHDLVV